MAATSEPHAKRSLPAGVDALVDALLARDLACPHCRTRNVHRWGQRHGRQRWRCTSCRRTFNSFTGTPLAYCKRPDAWDGFARAMTDSLSVRQAALQCGVHRNTAFRWRHRLLAALRRLTTVRLQGVVELHETSIRYSEKGRREADPDAAPGRPWYACWRYGRVAVIVLRDRFGVSHVSCLPSPWAVAPLLRAQLANIRLQATSIHSARGPFSAHAQLASMVGATFGDARPTVPAARVPPRSHVRNARAEAARLHVWMKRFRGVATKYLPNYLTWHVRLDAVCRSAAELLLSPAFARSPPR